MGKLEQPSSVVHNVDFPSRVKRSTPLGTFLLVVLRVADVFLQYTILSRWGPKLINLVGGRLSELALDRNESILGLQPYYFALVCLAAGSSMKQIIWVLFTSEQEMPVVAAVMIGVFNTVFNSINSMLSLWAWSSAATSEPLSSFGFLLGLSLFVIGIIFEQASEIQRKIFKLDPKNKGKPYAGGLFSIALNINYGGYTLWRAGYACVAAGLLWGGFLGTFFFYDFYSRAIPILDKYCTERYGDAFLEQKQRVPYRLIPGVY